MTIGCKDSRVSFFLRLLFAVSVAFLFWLCRDIAPDGGDSELYLSDSSMCFLNTDKLLYHYREPGSVWIWQGIHNTISNPDNIDIRQERLNTFAILASLSGGVFWWFLLSICSSLMQDGISLRRCLLFLFPCALSASTLVFMGEAEFYAPLYAGLMFWCWTMRKHTENPRGFPFWTVILAWCASKSCTLSKNIFEPVSLIEFTTSIILPLQHIFFASENLF